MVLLAAIGVVVGVVLVSSLLLRWNEVRYSRKQGLPPGTMGWPLFGETTEFLKQGPSFMKSRRLRYGRLFRTHILGCPTVVCMDPELNRHMLTSDGRGFVPGYPQSMLDILGRNNIAAVHGPLHRAMRGAMLALVRPAMIRDALLPKIDGFMRSHLAGWDGCLVDIQEKTKEMALLSALRQIAGISAGPLSDVLKTELYTLVLGTISLPFNLPGTNYYKGFQVATINLLLKTCADHWKGRCYAWDVVNEALNEDGTYRESIFYRILGEEYIKLAFRVAAEADPHAKLYYNDYNLERVSEKSEGARRIVRMLQAEGLKVDGVGMQAHLTGHRAPNLADQIAVHRSYAELGVETALTELDVRLVLPLNETNLAWQRQVYYDTVAACVEVEACVGVTLWDFYDPFSWVPYVFEGEGAAGLWFEDFSKHPAYDGVVEALKGKTAPPCKRRRGLKARRSANL